MTDLIVFLVGENRYAMRIENIQRIIQAVSLTNIPNAHSCIDGIMSHEDKVLKVLNFRKMIDLPGFEEELITFFIKLKQEHVDWLESLRTAVNTGGEFDKTFNPHMCELGKWIDNFTAYDDRVAEVLSSLMEYHKQLHTTGSIVYEMRLDEKEKAKKMMDEDMHDIFTHSMSALDTFTQEIALVSDSLQKFLIYENNDKVFAIKVDKIDDIAHIEENKIMSNENEDENSEYLSLDGVLDINNVLVNVIKTVNLPK